MSNKLIHVDALLAAYRTAQQLTDDRSAARAVVTCQLHDRTGLSYEDAGPVSDILFNAAKEERRVKEKQVNVYPIGRLKTGSAPR